MAIESLSSLSQSMQAFAPIPISNKNIGNQFQQKIDALSQPNAATGLPQQLGTANVPGSNNGGLAPGLDLSQLKGPSEISDRPQLLPTPTNPLGAAPQNGQDSIRSFIHAVDGKSKVAGSKVAGLMAGENVSLGETMVSLQESKISFQLMVEVRNKLLESYQELMRMQV